MARSSLRHRVRRVDSPLLWSVASVPCAGMARLTRSARWYVRLGYAHERRGRLDLARSAYTRAVTRPESRPQWLSRLAEVHERQKDWGAAERVWQLALDANPESIEHRVRVGRARAKHTDWAGAIRAFEAVVEQDRGRADVWEQLGHARWRSGDRRGAMDAYRHGLRIAGRSSGPTPRLRLAELLSDIGHWPEAREVLLENVAVHHRHAASYRLLAEVARQMWMWNGFFEGPADDLTEARYQPLPSARAGLDRAQAHQEVCRGTEWAAALDTRESMWWQTVGDVRREAGYLAGAVAGYEVASKAAAASESHRAFNALQRLEYGLEAAHHAMGQPRVEDPLFESAVTLEETSNGPPPGAEHPDGFFTAALTFSGLRIHGFLLSEDVDSVDVSVDGVTIRRLNVGGNGFFPTFSFRIARRTLEVFPKEARLQVRTKAGNQLSANGRGNALRLSFPHGSGQLLDRIEHGQKLDKKGTIDPSVEETRARQDAYLELYAKARDFFDEVIGKPLFLVYGTLLGLYRDQDFIAGDDDFDAAYISEKTDPVAVKAEAKDIIVQLVQAGFTVLFNRRGRLFRLQDDAIGDATLHLDLRPMFFMGGKVWLHNYASFPCDMSDFLPAEERTLRGTSVYVPRRPEVFLEGHYGPGWRVPDPGFIYHPSEVDPAVTKTLNKLLITPSEYQSLKTYLEQGEGFRPAMGKLVSLGSESLYPLSPDRF